MAAILLELFRCAVILLSFNCFFLSNGSPDLVSRPPFPDNGLSIFLRRALCFSAELIVGRLLIHDSPPLTRRQTLALFDVFKLLPPCNLTIQKLLNIIPSYHDKSLFQRSHSTLLLSLLFLLMLLLLLFANHRLTFIKILCTVCPLWGPPHWPYADASSQHCASAWHSTVSQSINQRSDSSLRSAIFQMSIYHRSSSNRNVSSRIEIDLGIELIGDKVY